MRPHPISSSTQVDAFIEKLWHCERSGRFEEGLCELSEDWASPMFEPDVSGLAEPQSLELQLRFAALLGYQGHIRKIQDSQLRARDILTRTLDGFCALENSEKSAECENHIALTYWRTGEFAEARTWLDTARSRDLDVKSSALLSSIVTLMIINVGEQLFEENVGLFSEHEEVVREFGDNMLNGSFHLNAGIGFMELDRKNEALRCIELAKYFYEADSIEIYFGAVENELAHVYCSVGKFNLAHRSVDRGIELFRESGDLTREGFLYDTKAAIYLDEGKTDLAFTSIEKAIQILKEAENSGFLAETLLTKAKIVLSIDGFAAAVSVLFEAVQIACTYSGDAFAETLIKQFEQAVKELNAPAPKQDKATHDLETGEMEFVLPPSIPEFASYDGVWINNSHLECVGISKGMLAIIVDDRVERGDLAAISEIETGEVSCGFYDSDFGVVCLDGCDAEPLLFDQKDVKIVGKIVGICDGESDPDGKFLVRPVPKRP